MTRKNKNKKTEIVDTNIPKKAYLKKINQYSNDTAAR